MIDDRDRERVLWAAIEDYPGLWELVWELESLHPGELTNQARAKVVIEESLLNGLVVVYSADGAEADLRAVPSECARALLAPDRAWAAPRSLDEPVVRVGATAAGEARYRALRQGTAT